MMFKKITIIALLMITGCTASADTDLPFVGEREFGFTSGNFAVEIIEIKSTGHTTITLHGKDSSLVLYEGMYQQEIPIIEDESSSNVSYYYQIIGNNAIAMLDSKRDLISDCDLLHYNGNGGPCVAMLW